MKKSLNTLDLSVILLFALMFLPIIGWGHFGDEHEQATAGYLIWHGLLPYKDFFSHHAPLPLLLSALYKFIPINNQVLALRALVAVLQIGAWTWLLSVSQKQFKAVIYLVITLLALALPTFSLQMMLADTLVTTAFALILLTTIQYWWLKQPNLGTVLRVFLIGSFVMIWSSVASTLLVLLMGLLILAAGHQQQKKQVKEQFKKYLAIWTGLQLIFPGIYLLIGRFREFWWQLVTYNNQYYFPLKLARTQAQRDGGMLFRIVDEFWLMISGELATFFGSLLVLARSVLGSWRLFFDTNSDWVGYFSLVWREFGQNFASVRFDLSVGIGLIFLWLILRKRWQLAIVFVLTALASFFRSSETFHLGPEFVLVIVGLSLMVVKSWRKGRRRSRLGWLTLGSLCLLAFCYALTRNYLEFAQARAPLIHPEILNRSAQIKATTSPNDKLLVLNGELIYYPLADRLPACFYHFSYPWLEAAPQIKQTLDTCRASSQGSNLVVTDKPHIF